MKTTVDLLNKKVPMMMGRVLVTLVVMAGWADGHCPVRELPSTLGHRPMSTDGGFYLTVSGNPEHYEPGALYTVSLRVRTLPGLYGANLFQRCCVNPTSWLLLTAGMV